MDLEKAKNQALNGAVDHLMIQFGLTESLHRSMIYSQMSSIYYVGEEIGERKFRAKLINALKSDKL